MLSNLNFMHFACYNIIHVSEAGTVESHLDTSGVWHMRLYRSITVDIPRCHGNHTKICSISVVMLATAVCNVQTELET